MTCRAEVNEGGNGLRWVMKSQIETTLKGVESKRDVVIQLRWG